MKNRLLTAVIAIMASVVLMSNTQKKPKVTYDKQTGIISVDAVKYAHLSKENAPGQMGINKNYTISNFDGEELMYMVFNQEAIRDAWGRETKEKKVWYKITFLGSGKHGTRDGTMTLLRAAKIASTNNLIVDGKIDPVAEKKFLLKY